MKKNYDWVEMLFLLPLSAAIDTRAKLAKDATIIHPPLNTSTLEKSSKKNRDVSSTRSIPCMQ